VRLVIRQSNTLQPSPLTRDCYRVKTRLTQPNQDLGTAHQRQQGIQGNTTHWSPDVTVENTWFNLFAQQREREAWCILGTGVRYVGKMQIEAPAETHERTGKTSFTLVDLLHGLRLIATLAMNSSMETGPGVNCGSLCGNCGTGMKPIQVCYDESKLVWRPAYLS